MRRRGWVAVVLVIVVCGSTTVLAAESTAPEYGERTGVVFELSAQTEQQRLEEMEQLAEQFGLSPRTHAMLMQTDSASYIVFTDRQPTAGRATVEGTVIEPSELGGSTGAIFADSVSFDTTGERVPWSDLRQNPREYQFELVRTTTTYRQLSYYTEAQDVNYVETFTSGTLGGQAAPFALPPGRTGRWVTLNLSANDYGGDPQRARLRRLQPRSNIGNDRRGVRWWMRGRATVDLIVMSNGDVWSFYIVGVDPKGQSIDSLSAIHERGDQLAGQVVTVEANALGTQLSPQETLLKTAKCAPQSVFAPIIGCAPIPTDVSIHAGVLFGSSPSSFDDVVVYAGLSNQQQGQPATVERGQYRVTGRVVSTSQIDPRLPDGYALMIYDRERVGDLSASTGDAAALRNQVRDRIQEQIRSESPISEQTPTPTPTTTPTATPAPTPTPTPTATPVPAALEITNLGDPSSSQISPGESVAVSVTLRNRGERPGEIQLRLSTSDGAETTTTVRVPGQTTKTVTLGLTIEATGTVELRVNGRVAGEVTVGSSGGRLLPIDNNTIVFWSGVIGAPMYLGALLSHLYAVIKNALTGEAASYSEREVHQIGVPSLVLLGIVFAVGGVQTSEISSAVAVVGVYLGTTAFARVFEGY